MHSLDSRIVADGPQRLREAGNYAGERQRLMAELAGFDANGRREAPPDRGRDAHATTVGGEHSKMNLNRSTTVWRRIRLQLKLWQVVRAELNEKFPPSALYMCRLR